MNNHFPPAKPHADPIREKLPVSHKSSVLTTGFKGLIIIGILLAFSSGALLLANDVFPYFAHAPVSAAPLLLIGLASLCFQLVVRPKSLDLFKSLIVIVAFLLWGIDQLLPAGWLATLLGDLVIVLYVLDLGWMMLERSIQSRSEGQVPQAADLSAPSEEDISTFSTQPLHILPISRVPTRSPQRLRPVRLQASPALPEQENNAGRTKSYGSLFCLEKRVL